MRRRNGFTLIELLIVISIMISILVISIISYVSVSNGKKQEAWELVQKEIEIAAEEYFYANEYLFDGLDTGTYGDITVGKLVEENYLNKVTDPRSEKEVDKCSYVKVTKNTDGYDASYTTDVLDDKMCNVNDSVIIITEPGAPSISPVVNCTKGNNNWCVSDAEINLNISTNNNGKITEVNKTEKNDSLCSLSNDNNTLNCNKEGITTVNVVVTNVNGKSAKWTGELKIDKTVPGVTNVNLRSQKSYNSNLVFGSFTVEDNVSGINYVTSNIPNASTGQTKWYRNGDKEWVIDKYSGKAADDLDGSKVTMKIYAEDMAGNQNEQYSNDYNIYKECSSTTTSTSNGSWSSCSKSCGGGTRTRTITTTKKDAYTNKTCDKATKTETQKCNTQSCLSLTKISGVDSTYCSLRNPWGYSNKKYNEEITGNNCRNTNSNPRVIFSNINGTINGTTATISVTLDIYSTSWEMLATSSDNDNARYICVTNSNKFSSGKCISNSVEIKSKSSKWSANSHVLNGKKVTLTIKNVDDYSNLAFKIYSPGKGVNANPTCTHSSGSNCKTSTGSPFVFQSSYFFKVNK